MDLNGDKKILEEDNFEKELKKRLRVEIEKDAQNIYINFNEDDNLSNEAKNELCGLDDFLYEYYISVLEKDIECSKLDEEEKWKILDEKVNSFFQNFTDNNLKEMYENSNFTEVENKYMQLRNMRIGCSTKNALVEILIRRKLFEIFGEKEISKMLMLVSEKSFKGKNHIMQLMSDNPFRENVSERWEKEIDERVQDLFNNYINCGGYALKIDQCFFTPVTNKKNEGNKVVEEDAQVISSYLEKFPFIRLLGDAKLEDDEYMVIYRTVKGHANEERHFVRVEKDGTVTEKDGNGPVRRFENWSPSFQNENEIIEIVFAVKEKHQMFGYTPDDVNCNCNGLNFEQTVEQAIDEKKNAFLYHCKEYFLKKDKEGNVIVCSNDKEKKVIVADIIIESQADKEMECVTVVRDGFDGIIQNYEGTVKPIIADGKLVNYDSFRNIKCKADSFECRE